MPATVKLRNVVRSNYFLNFGDFDSLEAYDLVNKDLYSKDFSNPIDYLACSKLSRMKI